jgi:hypothetical protein
VFASRKGGKWGPLEGSPDIFDVIDLVSDDPIYEQELLPLTEAQLVVRPSLEEKQ